MQGGTDGKVHFEEVGSPSSAGRNHGFFRVLMLLLGFRVALVFAVRSFSGPEEAWNGTEVAHNIVFGYGPLSWEWTRERLFGYLHPSLYAWIYKLLSLAEDNYSLPGFLFSLLPRVFQAVLGSIADVHFYFFLKKRFGVHLTNKVFLLYLSSAFVNYYWTRTTSNTTQVQLTLVALYYLEFPSRQFLGAIALALAVAVHPPAAVNLVFLFARNFFNYGAKRASIYALKHWIPAVLAVFGAATYLDTVMYGEFTVPALNSFRFSLENGPSSTQRAVNILWYMYVALPEALTLLYPFFVLGIYQELSYTFRSMHRGSTDMLAMVFVNILSMGLRNERRHCLVLQIVPFASLFSVYGLRWFLNKVTSKFSKRDTWKRQEGTYQVVVSLMIGFQIFALIYFGYFHQEGRNTVMADLRNLSDERGIETVHFLTPCQSTPFYSWVHKNITMKPLNCTPPAENLISQMNEDEKFHLNPLAYILNVYEDEEDRPDAVVIFDQIYHQLNNIFKSWGYSICSERFNSQFQNDPREILILCRG